MEVEKIKKIVEDYKTRLRYKGGLGKKGCNELYKWELITKSQSVFDVNSDRFLDGLESVKFDNLLYYLASGVIRTIFCRQMFDEYKKIVKNLFDESIDLSSRIVKYIEACEELYKLTNGKGGHYQDERTAATLLSIFKPEKYSFYKFGTYKSLCEANGIARQKNSYVHYLSILNEIKAYIETDDELCEMIGNETKSLVQSNLLIAQDIVFQMHSALEAVRVSVSDDGVYDCACNITENEWISIIQDEDIYDSKTKAYITQFLNEPLHKSTCGALAKKYNSTPSSYISVIVSFARRVMERLDRFRIVGQDGKDTFWVIPMTGRYLDNGNFEWTLRPELVNALKAANKITGTNMTSENISKYVELLKANKNIVLTGAPGTGKSYLAKLIAQELIHGNGEMEFVQFHPSYDYTDFVEGLRAEKSDDGDVNFTLRNGIFKEFCMRAIKKEQKNYDFDELYDDFITQQVQNITLVTPSYNLPIDFEVRNGSFNIKTEKTINKVSKEIIKKYVLNGIVSAPASYTKAIGEKFKEIYTDKLLSTAVNCIDKKYVFIIDEINRGEISKIFGELFYSIDPGYRGEKGKIKTQYSNLHSYENNTVFDIELGGGWFYIPDNVYIIGTMNDIDRSVESMDFAMRRRFTWIEVDANSRTEMLHATLDTDTANDAINRMNAINGIIEGIDGLGKAYHIGPAYFMKLKSYIDSNDGDGWEKLWHLHIEPLVKEYLRGMHSSEANIERIYKAYMNISEDNDYEAPHSN